MLKDIHFWIAVFVAVLIKVRTSERLSWRQVLVTIVVSVGAAYVAASWVAEITNIPEAVAAALVALTAEGLMRLLLVFSSDPAEAIKLWKAWKQ